MNALLYKDYEDDCTLEDQFRVMKAKYAAVEGAIHHIIDLQSKKGQLCYTLTKELFTCGGTMSQQGETINSQVRSNDKSANAIVELVAADISRGFSP